MPSLRNLNANNSSAFASYGSTTSPSASQGMNLAAAIVLEEEETEEQIADRRNPKPRTNYDELFIY